MGTYTCPIFNMIFLAVSSKMNMLMQHKEFDQHKENKTKYTRTAYTLHPSPKFAEELKFLKLSYNVATMEGPRSIQN